MKKLWWFIRNQISTIIRTSRKFTRGSRAGRADERQRPAEWHAHPEHPGRDFHSFAVFWPFLQGISQPGMTGPALFEPIAHASDLLARVSF